MREWGWTKWRCWIWFWRPRTQFWSSGFGFDAMKELYVGAKCTTLPTTIFFMSLCIIHEVNNKFANELFSLLWHHLFLGPNCLATNYYAIMALTQKLGLDYENIHACVKGCVLFWGDHKDDVNCPKCGSVRYKDVVNKVLLMKMFRHFPIILRFQWPLRTPAMFELMLWHTWNSNSDDLMKH